MVYGCTQLHFPWVGDVSTFELRCLNHCGLHNFAPFVLDFSRSNDLVWVSKGKHTVCCSIWRKMLSLVRDEQTETVGA